MIDGQGINICDRTASDHCDEYIELHASSAFSFLGGASEPESFIERAVELEMPAMALSDRNGLYGAARFHTSAKLNEVKAHIGAEIAVSSFGNRLVPPSGFHTTAQTNLRVSCCSAHRKSDIRIFAN